MGDFALRYMGNKGKMLPILGDILLHHSRNVERIADPFCGSASVSWFLAEKTNKAIVSGDIQSFAVARASSVIERTEKIDPRLITADWFARAGKIVDSVASHFPNHLKSIEPDLADSVGIQVIVNQSRKFCKEVLPVVFRDYEGAWPISKAYGGYYYSPVQALIFDALRQTLPIDPLSRNIGLAALVEAASKAVASPGHTAQPFQPTESSAKYIIEAWLKDPFSLVKASVIEIAGKAAQVQGLGMVGDFSETISHLQPGDMVFADPPYSGVHYSRFYHVLETITRGTEFEPEGSGRYPALSDRPSSLFSMRSKARGAATQLLNICADKKLSLILTFPTAEATNGLKASEFVEAGKPLFSKIEVQEVQTDFSTMGGNKKLRAARQLGGESIIVLQP